MAAVAVPQSLGIGGWLRIALRIAALALVLACCIPLYYLTRALPGRHNPWPRAFLASVVRIAGVDVEVSGDRLPGGVFLLANHVSWIDIPAIAGVTGAAFVGHDGLASMPLLRWLCTMNDTVFVARHDRASIARQIEDVRAALRDTGALAIFPEGTTSDGTGLLPFKSSLLSALDPVPPGIAVQPVGLDFGVEAASIAWVGEEHGLHNFLRVLARRRPVRLRMHFLPPLEGDALANRKTMAAAARSAILLALQKRT